MSGAGRARLFVALDLPAHVRGALAAWGRRVARGQDERALRLLGEDQLHATLCFLGWRDEDQVEETAALALGAAREGGSAPHLVLGAPAWLPRRRPRVLAVDLADEAGELADLQARVSRALASGAGYEPEQRAFRPHVTVARVPRGARVTASAEQAGPAELAFAGEAVTLYRSHLSGAGARYEPLARAALAS